MIPEQRLTELEKDTDELKRMVDVNHKDIKEILKMLKKYYPQEFTPSGRLKPQQ